MINHELLSGNNLVHIVLTCFIPVLGKREGGGATRRGGEDTLELVATTETGGERASKARPEVVKGDGDVILLLHELAGKHEGARRLPRLQIQPHRYAPQERSISDKGLFSTNHEEHQEKTKPP